MAVQRACLFCSERFTLQNSRRLFCSDKCKVRYHRENGLRCFYCGDLADTKDHVEPHACGSPSAAKWLGRDTVSACRECNSLLGSAYPTDIVRRMTYLADRIVAKYKLHILVPEWDDDEIAELGPELRQFVRGKVYARQRASDRVWHVKAVRNAAAAAMDGVIDPGEDEKRRPLSERPRAF